MDSLRINLTWNLFTNKIAIFNTFFKFRNESLWTIFINVGFVGLLAASYKESIGKRMIYQEELEEM